MRLSVAVFCALFLILGAEVIDAKSSALPEIDMAELLAPSISIQGQLVSVTACIRRGAHLHTRYMIACGAKIDHSPYNVLNIDDSDKSQTVTYGAMQYLNESGKDEVEVKAIGLLWPKTSYQCSAFFTRCDGYTYNAFFPKEIKLMSDENKPQQPK